MTADIRSIDPQPATASAPPSPTRAAGRWRERPATWRAAARRIPVDGDGVFSDRVRRIGRAWVLITVPLVTLSGLLVHGQGPYLVSWTILGSGLYTTPGLLVMWLAVRRAPASDRVFWRLWFLGLVCIYAIGVSLLILVFTGFDPLRQGGGLGVIAAIIVFGVALVMMMRSRSGGRRLSIDMIEVAMIQVGIVALTPLLFGERILSGPATWFTVPAAFAAVALLSSCTWALLLFVRLRGERRTVEALGVALAFVASLSAIAQVAQGISDFTLPSSPLLGLQAVTMGLALLTPLHMPKCAAMGLERLPPQAQVRNGGLMATLPLIIVPLLLIETALRRDDTPWAVGYCAVVTVILLVLSTARHLLTVDETKRLYAKVEMAAEDRRRLLVDVMQSADLDRHRVAAQLHQQAISSYVAFASYVRSADDGTRDRVPDALGAVRDDLERQAESLRRLMLAIQPLEVARVGPDSITAMIAAYVDSLYGDAVTPVLVVRVDPDLGLDWTTETIILRILQEALRNVWGHAHAASITVSIDVVGSAVALRVEDDGIGFEPQTTLFESGIATMRSFAHLAGGEIEITSRAGHGTVVSGLFGEPPAHDERPVPSPLAAPRATRGVRSNRTAGLRVVTSPAVGTHEP